MSETYTRRHTRRKSLANKEKIDSAAEKLQKTLKFEIDVQANLLISKFELHQKRMKELETSLNS